jgi:hypothetical protein
MKVRREERNIAQSRDHQGAGGIVPSLRHVHSRNNPLAYAL